jgi:16S rRNA A1518/A1519 N6-dimethyltransferase RsmA/KsgA/DIM1 with predicted DNA glycosylase/AP lyase activity
MALVLMAPPGAQQTPRVPDTFFGSTRQPVVEGMLRLAKVTPADVVYDLGSGDGRIVVIAAQKFGARAVGVELDRKLLALSREIAAASGVADRATFIEGDFFKADISAATVVTLYLSASVNLDLEPKLKQELRTGTRIVSHQFPIGRWTPAETTQVDGANVFLWVVP